MNMTEQDLLIQQLRRENADIRRECDELIRACERRSTEADKWHRMYDEEKTRAEALTSQRDILLHENADLRRRDKGEWIPKEDSLLNIYYECSCCGGEFYLVEGTPDMNDYFFCPNCGADMREEALDEHT